MDPIVLTGIGFVLILLCVLARVAYELYLNGDYEEEKEEYLMEMFDTCWTGKHEDIPYAWFRVVQHLKQWNPDPDLIRMAEIKREQSLRIKSEAWIVTEDGELINTDEDNPNDLKVA